MNILRETMEGSTRDTVTDLGELEKRVEIAPGGSLETVTLGAG